MEEVQTHTQETLLEVSDIIKESPCDTTTNTKSKMKWIATIMQYDASDTP